MKYLSLQQAMLGMRVIMTDDGLILKSPAGSAHYDLKGRRHTVLGDASFFPEHLRVKDKRKPKCGHVSYGNGEIVAHRADGSVAWRMGKIAEPTKTPDAALGELSAVYTLPRYKISSDMKRQELIANALDEAKQRSSEVFGGFPADKTAVVFLADRWVAVEGGYTPDEMREAVEYIKRKRKEKADAKALAESSPFTINDDGRVFIKDAVIHKVQLSRTETDPRKGYAINVGIGTEIKTSVKLSPEMEKAISDAVSAELKKNLQPGGTIWTSLKRGF
ncbi:Uncharacterised protein [Enterobacter cancerogenus]|uniref:Uncharacterized protein n=1 Tax=Enterobacter cancerogenus TaxID=69218 RepID=A0A484X8D0_9ENTR|nr:Uncharacterised protein [Enterobacter cancerogenus]